MAVAVPVPRPLASERRPMATAAGSKVKVECTGEGAARTATKITVEAKDKK